MSNVLVNKASASRRQIDSAIRMLFAQEDVLAIHTIVAASHRVLSELAEQRGVKAIDFEHVVRHVEALLGRAPDPDRLAKELPAWQRWFRNERNRSANFLKHADRDGDALLDSNTLRTDDLLLEACVLYATLGFEFTPEMWAFGKWHLAVYPHQPGDAIHTSVGDVNCLPRDQQLEFGEFLIDLERDRNSAVGEHPVASHLDRASAIKEALEQVRTGQTIPGEEIDAWIDSWDTPNELPKPTPRRR